MDKIRILVADDHTLFREGLVEILAMHEGVEVVGEAEDGLDAVQKARETVPDIILMDVYMPRCNGIEALAIIKKELPAVNVVMLTVCDDDDNLFEALDRGAQGYLLKKISRRQLLELLDAVHRGEAALTSDYMLRVMQEYARRKQSPEAATRSPEQLTQRELDVLALVARGASDREIADLLCIAKSTVRFHVSNILGKLHVENRVQAAAWALREDLPGKERTDRE